jgi:hypothetical protein
MYKSRAMRWEAYVAQIGGGGRECRHIISRNDKRKNMTRKIKM